MRAPTFGRPPSTRRYPAERTTRPLLACGAGYAVVYVVANDVVGALMYDGYDRLDQAVSELSELGAPSRPFLVAMLLVFTALTRISTQLVDRKP